MRYEIYAVISAEKNENIMYHPVEDDQCISYVHEFDVFGQFLAGT